MQYSGSIDRDGTEISAYACFTEIFESISSNLFMSGENEHENLDMKQGVMSPPSLCTIPVII